MVDLTGASLSLPSFLLVEAALQATGAPASLPAVQALHTHETSINPNLTIHDTTETGPRPAECLFDDLPQLCNAERALARESVHNGSGNPASRVDRAYAGHQSP